MLENIKKPVFAMTHCQSFDKDNSKVFTNTIVQKSKFFQFPERNQRRLNVRDFPALLD